MNQLNMDQNFIIPGNVVQALGDYLVAKPYIEVAHLITNLQNVSPIGVITAPAIIALQEQVAQLAQKSIAENSEEINE